MSIFDKTINGLGTSLNHRLTRQDVVSANIANAETPGYKAQRVDFENELSRALELDEFGKMDAVHPGHLPAVRGRVETAGADIYDEPDVVVNNDGNTVDMEKEMARLSENTILYKAAVELINKKMGALKYVSMDGGR
ncbi:MAG: flagellar basal body rod protein FlgB [Bdellovibrionia bacterium]